jgi:hypothetical protein
MSQLIRYTQEEIVYNKVLDENKKVQYSILTISEIEQPENSAGSKERIVPRLNLNQPNFRMSNRKGLRGSNR